MGKHFQTFLNIVLIVVLILLLLDKCGQSKREAKLIKAVSQPDSLISSKIDDLGRRVQENTSRMITPDMLKHSQNGGFKEIRAELKRQGIKIKDLKGFIVLNSASWGTSSTTINNIDNITNFGDTSIVQMGDSTGVYAIADSQKHLTIEGIFDLNRRKFDYNWTHRDKLNIIDHQKRRNIFSPYTSQLTLIGQNPNSEYSLTTASIKQPVADWSLGVGLGASVVPDLNSKTYVSVKPSISIAVYKNLITIYRKR